MRVLDPDNLSFVQIYKNLRRGDRVFVYCYLKVNEDCVSIHNKVIFYTSGLISKFPWFLARYANRRFSSMWNEDKVMLQVRTKNEGFTNPLCAPEASSLYSELLRDVDRAMDQSEQMEVQSFEFKD